MKNKNKNKYILAHIKPNDAVSEAYRSARVSLLSYAQEKNIKSILVTSPGTQEGKTTTLCNLAIVLAQSGKKVLLVDADVRRPQLKNIFFNTDKGLVDYLTNGEPLKNITYATEVNNLYVVFSGAHTSNPSELLSTQRMRDFIALAKQDYDFVMVDSPPICLVADAAILCQMVDGVVVVFQSGKTPKSAVHRITYMLESVKANVVGIITNKIPLQTRDQSYYLK